MTAQLATPPIARESAGIARFARQREYGVLALLVVTLIAVGLVNHAFLAGNNLKDMMVAAVPSVIVACGLTFVVLMGEIDISMGALMGVLATTMGLLTSPTHAHLPVSEGIAAVLAIGTVIGLLNGTLVAYGRMPSIIVTLGMMTILQGVNLILINGRWITDLPPDLRWFGTGTVLHIPVSVWTAAIVVALSVLLAKDTPLGRRIYAAGSNPDAARLAGIPVPRMKLFVFALTGFLTAVAAVVSVPQLSVVEPSVGQGFELLVVTCVVVGGVSISGGQGSIAGAVLAALLLAVVRPMLLFLRLGPSATYWERAIQGLFILAAVLIDQIGRSGILRAKRRRSAR